MKDDGQNDEFEWYEGIIKYTSNPKKLEEYPDSHRFENAILLEDYVKKLLSSVVGLHFSNDVGLSKSRLKRMKMVTLTIQMYLDSIGICIFPVPEVPITQG